ncbi:hypothetical protein GOEFS_028_00120 [Gordonia effusa NBRC 100432]|uniref:TVP38/TMEM64 family membrane protein n=1 Tax=Gordonia effusa NBRC 100432 TaxID=1077974 RepID=H0QWZ7_9ACTN|nr:TVP38/TMEM64 family protein [Gordonia effusa]GAB17348.1 hypothetical protein GOEFS_028_00120 [Gordonia effusa NBRC 100432]
MTSQQQHPTGSDAVLAADIRSTVKRRVLVGVIVILIFIGPYAILMPSADGVREWGEGLGAWFPYVFFTLYAVITIFPIPRSAFTVMSGLLFGPAIGFIGAITASTVAAVTSFLLVRAIGRNRVQPYLRRPVARAVEARLSRRGWLAVGSLRLIAACPFALANYCSALSSVRLLPFTLATVVGMAPGTAAVVFLGDALAGNVNFWLMASTVVFFGLGIFGLIVDAILPVPKDKREQLSVDAT